MEINIGVSECHKNVVNYYGSNITVWILRCAGREAFDSVKPLPEFQLILARPSDNQTIFQLFFGQLMFGKITEIN